jgi:hypothetical protein
VAIIAIVISVLSWYTNNRDNQETRRIANEALQVSRESLAAERDPVILLSCVLLPFSDNGPNRFHQELFFSLEPGNSAEVHHPMPPVMYLGPFVLSGPLALRAPREFENCYVANEGKLPIESLRIDNFAVSFETAAGRMKPDRPVALDPIDLLKPDQRIAFSVANYSDRCSKVTLPRGADVSYADKRDVRIGLMLTDSALDTEARCLPPFSPRPSIPPSK